MSFEKLKLKNYRHNYSAGYISLLRVCISIYDCREKKNNKKLLYFLFPHSTYSFHSTSNIRSIPKSFVENFCLVSKSFSRQFLFANRTKKCEGFLFKWKALWKASGQKLIEGRFRFGWRRKTKLIKAFVLSAETNKNCLIANICVIAAKGEKKRIIWSYWIIHKRFEYTFGVLACGIKRKKKFN